jgi:hypothetical protein
MVKAGIIDLVKKGYNDRKNNRRYTGRYQFSEEAISVLNNILDDILGHIEYDEEKFSKLDMTDLLSLLPKEPVVSATKPGNIYLSYNKKNKDYDINPKIKKRVLLSKNNHRDLYRDLEIINNNLEQTVGYVELSQKEIKTLLAPENKGLLQHINNLIMGAFYSLDWTSHSTATINKKLPFKEPKPRPVLVAPVKFGGLVEEHVISERLEETYGYHAEDPYIAVRAQKSGFKCPYEGSAYIFNHRPANGFRKLVLDNPEATIKELQKISSKNFQEHNQKFRFANYNRYRNIQKNLAKIKFDMTFDDRAPLYRNLENLQDSISIEISSSDIPVVETSRNGRKGNSRKEIVVEDSSGRRVVGEGKVESRESIYLNRNDVNAHPVKDRGRLTTTKNILQLILEKALVADGILRLYINDLRYFRVFGKDTKSGGRFYNSVSNLPGFLRTRLVLNNKNTIELDFASLHPNMLRALEGLPALDDVYIFDKKTDKAKRDIAKIIMLVIINHDSERTCNSVIAHRLAQLGLPYKDYRVVKQRLLEKHKDIEKYFFTGIGVELMNRDSDIANRVMVWFSKIGIPILCIHDSFIAPGDKMVLLSTMMQKYYKKVMQTKYNIGID